MLFLSCRLHLRLRFRLGFFFVVNVAVLAGGVPSSVLFSLLLVFSGFTSFLGMHFFLFPSLPLLLLAGVGEFVACGVLLLLLFRDSFMSFDYPVYVFCHRESVCA